MHNILLVDMISVPDGGGMSLESEHGIYVSRLAEATQRSVIIRNVIVDEELEPYCEQNDIDIVVFAIENSSRLIQRCLNASRGLRIPYIFVSSTMHDYSLPGHLLVPVTMLEEEVYKAQVAVTFSRRLECEVSLLCAHDYGSKARTNAGKIRTLLQQADASVKEVDAMKDSFRLYNEVIDRQRELKADMIFWTASRDYGLDDIIFGPPERKIIAKSLVPVMLVSPRDDLFSLCD